MKNFLLGSFIASVVWMTFVGWVGLDFKREYRVMEDQCFSEAYMTKKMNKGLLKENRILYTEINRLKKQTQGAMPSKADKKS